METKWNEKSTADKIMLVLRIIISVVVLAGAVLQITGTVLFFASLVQAFIFYKCPHCGYSLMNVRGEVPEHCPKCGKELKEE